MTSFLMIDIGAGTQDILVFDDQNEFHYKLVAPTPARRLADEIERLEGDLAIVGHEMGGGRVSEVIAKKAKTNRVIMTQASAATLHHNLERVRCLGIRIEADSTVEKLVLQDKLPCVRLGDIRPKEIENMLDSMGIGLAFDIVGVCLQDHGIPPTGVSHLDFRHQQFRSRLSQDPHPRALLFSKDEIPDVFHRMKAAACDAAWLNASKVFVMDSGMAAVLGASLDERVQESRVKLVLDVATSHTVAALFEGGELAGFFEYHTKDLTVERLDELLVELAQGSLSHEKVLAGGGHGAYVRKGVGWEQVGSIMVTGPKRDRISGSRHPLFYGAPLGDNMMTGTYGLLRAIQEREG